MSENPDQTNGKRKAPVFTDQNLAKRLKEHLAKASELADELRGRGFSVTLGVYADGSVHARQILKTVDLTKDDEEGEEQPAEPADPVMPAAAVSETDLQDLLSQ